MSQKKKKKKKKKKEKKSEGPVRGRWWPVRETATIERQERKRETVREKIE